MRDSARCSNGVGTCRDFQATMYKLSDGIPKHLTDMLDAAICLQMSILEVGSLLSAASPVRTYCAPTRPALSRGCSVAPVHAAAPHSALTSDEV